MRVKSNKPTPPADGVLKALGHLVVQKADGAADSPPVFRITSEVLDRHRDRVKPNALKTDNYVKNPVLLWNHNDWVPAIGTARVFQEGDAWLMEPSFDGIGELSKDVAAKVAAKTLRTCSIRFRSLKYAYNEEGGLDYEEVELLEVSITNIPANPEAERVKTNGQQQKSGTTPPEAVVSKALEQADLEAIQAAMAEAMKPLTEKMAEVSAKLDALCAEQEPAADEVDADKDEGGSDDGGEGQESNDEGDLEMSTDEEEELKAFFTRAGMPTKK